MISPAAKKQQFQIDMAIPRAPESSWSIPGRFKRYFRRRKELYGSSFLRILDAPVKELIRGFAMNDSVARCIEMHEVDRMR